MRKRCRNLQIIDPMFVWGLAQAQNLLTFDYVREFNLDMNVTGVQVNHLQFTCKIVGVFCRLVEETGCECSVDDAGSVREVCRPDGPIAVSSHTLYS